MESTYIVSARKYRPSTFDSVVGQKSITTTLKNAINNSQLAQAYLFCGPRGVGKTTCARIFAKTINCQNIQSKIEACNECDSCKAFNSGRSMNIHELDAASNNSVDDIRNLIDQVRIPPQIGKYSVYIIDEVHMLSTQAFNAFLKTLEEPPKHAIFILATTEKHKILPTILSRCQIFDFNRIKVNDIVDHLLNIAEKEGIEAEPEALNILAQKADGALRDALSFFDQIASFANKEITYEKVINSLNVLDYDYYFNLVDNFLEGNYKETLLIFNEILNKGFDTQNFIVGLSSHFRDLLVSKDSQTIQLMEIGDSIKKKYIEQSQKTQLQFLLKGLDLISKADVEHKMSQNKRLHTELLLLQLSQIDGILSKKIKTEDNQQQPLNKQDKKEIKQTQIENKAKQIETENKKEENTEPEKIEKAPVQNKYKSSMNVTSMLNGKTESTKKEEKEKEKKEEITYQINENVTAEDVLEEWKNFGKKFETTRPRLYLVFSEYPVSFENNTLTLKVTNPDQRDYMNKMKPEIIHKINTNLQTKIEMNIIIEEFKLEKRKPYTPEEKYKYLHEKNPDIDKLTSEFRLMNK